MRPRPPSLRTKKRYVLARIHPPWRDLDLRSIQEAVSEAATSLWGDMFAGRMQPSVVFTARGFFIIRCRRGEEDRLAAALATVFSCGEAQAHFQAIARSGTILSLKRRIALMPMKMERVTVRRGERYREAVKMYGDKVDLIEKGIKNQELTFFTESEIEES